MKLTPSKILDVMGNVLIFKTQGVSLLGYRTLGGFSVNYCSTSISMEWLPNTSSLES